MVSVLAVSAWLALAPFLETPKEKFARFGLALIVALALTLIVLFREREREPHAVARVSTSSAISARTST
jgi:hypothetical protein